MRSFLQKITSRKFIAAAAGVVMGLAMVFGLDEAMISTVSGAIVSVASVITYIITEGRVDAAAVGKAIEDVEQAVEIVTTTEVVQDE